MRQQVFELMTQAGQLIESLPSEGERDRMHNTAIDDLLDARGKSELFNGGALFNAYVAAVRDGEQHSRRVPPLAGPVLRVVKNGDTR